MVQKGKFLTGLTTVLVAAIIQNRQGCVLCAQMIKLPVDPVRNSIRWNNMTHPLRGGVVSPV